MTIARVIISLLILAIASVNAKVVSVTSCLTNGTQEVRVDICTTDPCEFKRGSGGEVDMDFVAPADSSGLTAELTIKIGGLDIPHPTFDRDACNDHGVQCPVIKGQKYTYKYVMQVMAEYPKIKSTIHWVVKDDSGNQVLCFTMPLSVVD